jgi:hypothetical protein
VPWETRRRTSPGGVEQPIDEAAVDRSILEDMDHPAPADDLVELHSAGR